jgi:hypothetical protein
MYAGDAHTPGRYPPQQHSTYGASPTSYSVAPRHHYHHHSESPQQHYGGSGGAVAGPVSFSGPHYGSPSPSHGARYVQEEPPAPSSPNSATRVGQLATFSLPLVRASVITDDGAMFEFGSVALYCEPYRVVAAVPHATLQLAPVWAEDYSNITYLGCDDRRVTISAGPSQVRGLAPDGALAAGLAAHIASLRRQNQELDRQQRLGHSHHSADGGKNWLQELAEPIIGGGGNNSNSNNNTSATPHRQQQQQAAATSPPRPGADFGVQCGKSVTERDKANRDAEAAEAAARAREAETPKRGVPPGAKGPPPSSKGPPAGAQGTKAKAPPPAGPPGLRKSTSGASAGGGSAAAAPSEPPKKKAPPPAGSPKPKGPPPGGAAGAKRVPTKPRAASPKKA